LPLPISFLSDYGYDDEFVGVCHGVIERIAPGTRVIDVAHGLAAHSVKAAALVLRNTLPYLPAGIHLAIVDPGVGSDRRAVVLECGDRLFIGPDNGLLIPAAERAGGIDRAIDVSDSPWRLDPVSATFHGRDLFAPVAARLALDEPPIHAGEPLASDLLERIELPRPEVADGTVVTHVLSVDRFGNVQLDAHHEEMAQAGIAQGERIEIESCGNVVAGRYARTFADVPEGALLAYLDSYGALALAVNRGNARALLAIGPEAEIRVRRQDG
jgi:S-adenosylmethionine hydrolase